MGVVPYEKQTVANPNPIARFAHRKRLEKSKGLVTPFLNGPATLLDYGCGPGLFLHNVAADVNGDNPDLTLLGFDPFMPAEYDDYRVIADSDTIADESVSVLTAFEVCEHLTEIETKELIDFALRVLAPTGRLLVSVPIEMGPVILVKELSRTILFRRSPEIAPLELLKAVFVGKPPSRAADIKASHRGFDWRCTHQTLSDMFHCEHIEFSPLPFDRWWVQSQVFMLFRKR
jgi:SAM-dependent methyltransferase